MLLAGILLSAIGGDMRWAVIGGAEFAGNLGRSMSFADRLALSAAFLVTGVVLILLARRHALRLAERVRRAERGES